MNFCFLLKIWVKKLDENTSKSLSSKYSPGMLATRQKLLDHAKQSATDALKTSSKRNNQKTAEATGDLIGNKTANKIRRFSENSQQNNSEAVTNEHDKETLKRYISPEERQKIIDNLGIKVIV